MKTAAEWFSEMLVHPLNYGGYLGAIEHIQADALRWASEQAWPHDACGKILAEAERLEKRVAQSKD